MNPLKMITILLTVFFTITFQSPALAQTGSNDIQAAENSFKDGDFAQAERICTQLLKRNRNDFQAAALKGHLALLSNQLSEAQKWLSQALALKPGDKPTRVLLAEVFYRDDEFQKAASLQRQLGDAARASMLESFSNKVPYQQVGKHEIAHLKFVQTDPLPLVSVRVNGVKKFIF